MLRHDAAHRQTIRSNTTCFRRCLGRTCAGSRESYGIVIRYINQVGLGERDPFACPLVEQRRAI